MAVVKPGVTVRDEHLQRLEKYFSEVDPPDPVRVLAYAVMRMVETLERIEDHVKIIAEKGVIP
jgi:hypothetical protein